MFDLTARVMEETQKLPSIFARVYSNYAERGGGQETLWWTPAEAYERLGDAFRLANTGLVVANSGDAMRASPILRRAAELLEWLLEDFPETDLDLLCCLLYQIAGFPAIAGSIARSRSAQATNPIYVFAGGDFSHAEPTWLELARFLGSGPNDSSNVIGDEQRARSFLVSGLGFLIANLKWGVDTSGDVSSCFDALSAFFAASRDDLDWLLARCLKLVAERMTTNSLRAVATQLNPQLSNAGKVALERYIRQAFIKGHAVAWPSQIAGINEVAKASSFAMCTPTGSGKTTIAELAIIQTLFSGGEGFFSESAVGRLVLYLVPSRALAREVEERLSKTFRDSDSFPVQVVSSYSGNDISPLDQSLTSQQGTVLVCTQERADALIRSSGGEFLSKLKLLILDEAHSVNAWRERDLPRAFKLETLVARITSLQLGAQCRCIALSAVVPDPTTLSRWINPDNPQAVFSDYRSTRQAFGRLSFSGNGEILIEYDILNGLPLGDSRQNRPKLRGVIPPFPYAQDRQHKGPEIQLRPLSLWVAIHLADIARADGGPVLITVGTSINNFAKDYVALINDWQTMPRFFEADKAQNTAAYAEALKSCEDYFGEDSYELQLLKNGIVVHHGKLPAKMASTFTRLVESGCIRIVLATSTLSEGVNLPFETVLFPSLLNAGSPMSAQYVRNAIGRAGRPGIAREGRALVLLGPGKTFTHAARVYRALVDELSETIEPPKPVSPLHQLLTAIYEGWKRVSGETSASAFYEWLELTSPDAEFADDRLTRDMDDFDNFLLSAMRERETIENLAIGNINVEATIQQIWNQTYYRAISRNDRPARILQARWTGLASRYSSDDSLRRCYKTSLGPRSARVLFNGLDQLLDVAREGFAYRKWTSEERLAYVIKLATNLCAVPEFDFRRSLKKNDPAWKDVLSWWMRVGNRMPSPAKLGSWYSIANTAFSFRLSWAIGSFLNCSFEDLADSDASLHDKLMYLNLPNLLAWLKEMLATGCIDPVQAAIFASNLAGTREDAYERAKTYYLSNSIDSDEIYDPERVTDWILQQKQTLKVRANEEFSLTATETSKTLRDMTSRVIPDSSADTTIWRDVSGYPVAVSPAVSQEHLNFDFVLNTSTNEIVGMSYL